MTGYVSSVQSLGAVDGPGVRYVVFMQGCPLRCKCCHNPETWEFGKGVQYTPEELFSKIHRYKNYFGKEGGVTVSGGEPLMQPQFVKELFELCRQAGISTCLDTSGCVLSDSVKELLKVCDIVLLDYKMTNDEDYKSFSGMEKSRADEFLSYLQSINKRTWLRQVIVPGINDSTENAKKLLAVKEKHPCVEKIEPLPFHNTCITKYEQLGLTFPLKDTPNADKNDVKKLFEKAEIFF